jgi:glycosyltransferase involved in cell wall biosynthesis
MRNLKILMLGWGNKAYIHSGLGVACYNLCKALSKKVKISLIIPVFERAFELENIDLISLGSIKIPEKSVSENKEEKEEEQTEEVQLAELIEIPIELQPYLSPTSGSTLLKELKKVKAGRKEKNVKTQKSSEYKDDDLGDSELLDKVLEYARIVEEKSKHIDFDIIHAHDWMTFLAGIYVKNATGKPLVLHIHSLDYDRVGGSNRSWVFNIERYAMSRADKVISVSQYTAGIIFSRYGLSSNKVKVVHNAIDPEDTFRLPSESNQKIVLFVGRITGMKGPKYFLQVAAAVYKKYKNVRFIMVGVGDELQEIRESEIYKDLKERIDLKGFVDPEELKLIYSLTDVYCLPSVSEPFGLTALEAAQFGIPVVLSTGSGVSEVLTSALTADFWDIDKMSGHIISLLSNEKLRRKQINAGYKDIENTSWAKAANEIVKVYKQVTA